MDREAAKIQLARLIKDGEAVLATKRSSEYTFDFVDDGMLTEWSTNVLITFGRLFGATSDYVQHAKSVIENTKAISTTRAQRLLAVLKSALRSVEDAIVPLASDTAAGVADPIAVVERLLARFHSVAKQLRVRRNEGKQPRATLDVVDEYDVQDLLHALLLVEFADVRREEWTPGVAGAQKRVDLVLWREEVFIETKMMRPTLNDTKLIEELTIDIRMFKEHPRCKQLVVFVYDPAERVANAAAIEGDLTKMTDGLPVYVFVRQR